MEKVIGLISANYATAGLGKLTEDRTVASLPYAGRYRMIDFALSNMVNAGINTVGLITPYKYRSLIDHVGAGKAWSLDRKVGGLFVLPGSVFGMFGTEEKRFVFRDLKRMRVFFTRTPAENVLITAANVICNVDYRKLLRAHEERGADITMVYRTAKENEPHVTRLLTEGKDVQGTAHGAKPGDKAFIDCFVIKRELLLQILQWCEPLDYVDFFDAVQSEFAKMVVYAYRFDGYARNIFSTQQYYHCSMELLDSKVNEELFTPERQILTKGRNSAPAVYGKEAVVRNSYITAGCRIRGNVENSIFFRGVLVHPGAVVRNSIIFQSCVIGPGATVENAILDRNNVIPEGVVLKGSPESVFVMEKKMRYYNVKAASQEEEERYTEIM